MHSFPAGPALLLFVYLVAATGAEPAGQAPASPPKQELGTTSAPRRITLDQALTLAEQYNPQIKAAAAQREGATAGITTARAYPNPFLNVYGGHQYSKFNRGVPGPPGVLQHYSVDQPLELPSVRQSRIAEAALRREATEFSLSEARLSVRAAVKQTFYEVLRRKSEIALFQENLRLIEDLRRRIQVQVDVGEAARLELTRAEAEVATARTIVRSAELRFLTALSALRAAISAPMSAQTEPQGTLSPPTPLPPLDSLTTDVIARHPAIAEAQAQVQRAEARLRYERALRKPQPTARAEYESQPDLGFFRFGFTIPLPIWNKREGPIGEAVAGFNEATAIADYRRLEITAALERAYGQYEISTQQVVSLESGVLREASAAVQAAEAAYKFGERGIIEVLDAQRVLRSVRLDLLNAQYDLQAALIELERLRALELPRNNP